MPQRSTPIILKRSRCRSVGRPRPLSAAFAVCALLFAAASVSAQAIRGTVTAAGSPVVGATIRLGEIDRTTQTGAKGEFSFRAIPDGVYHVVVSAAGYAPATRLADLRGDTVAVAFDLVPSLVTLKDLVVSAAPTARLSDDQYQSVSSKSLIDLQDSPGSSFAEKIADLPGVAARANGSAPSRPILRGLGDNEMVVLENGMRMGDIATYDPAHATPVEAIGVSRIDVVRGPAAILYGPNTIGGLVNVITDVVPSVSDHPLSGTIASEGNSVSNQYAGYFNTVYSSTHSAFRLSAGGLHSGDIRIPAGIYTDPGTGGEFRLDRMPQTFDHSAEAGAGYSFQGAFGVIGIGGKHYETNYGIPGTPPNPDWLTIPPTTSRIAQTRNTVELRSLFNVAPGFLDQLGFTASYNDYSQSEFPTAEDSSGVSDPQANHFHKRTFNGIAQFRQRTTGRLRGTLGLWTDIENLTIEGDQPLGPNSVTTGLAGYGYEEYAASARTRVQAGLRYDYDRIQTSPYPASTDPVFRTLNVSRLSNAVTASLGAVHQLATDLTLSFNLARSFRAPTVQELFAQGLDAASGTYSVGTAALAPEHGFGVDASLKGSFRRVAFEVSPYVNTISNYIFGFLRGDTIQNFPVRQFSATNARLEGFEAVIAVQPVEHLALRGSADYVRAADTRRNQPLPFIPPLRGLLRATWQAGAYTAMAEGRFAARQDRLGEGETPTAGHAIMNLGVGVRIIQGRIVHHVGVHVDNVFNTVYRDNLSVAKDFIPQPARGVRVNYQLVY